jgi:hypothetical protein
MRLALIALGLLATTGVVLGPAWSAHSGLQRCLGPISAE